MDNGIMPVMSMNGDGMGGNCFVWIFGLILLAMLGGGNGFGFGNNGNSNAIQADVNRGFDN